MMGSTHFAVGVAAYTIFTATGLSPLSPTTLIIAGIASTAPDIDRFFPGMHRKITHSLIAIAAVLFFAFQYAPELALAFTIGYTSHILLDMLTIAGVPLLYPIPIRFKIPLTSTGTFFDRIIVRYSATAIALFVIVKNLWSS